MTPASARRYFAAQVSEILPAERAVIGGCLYPADVATLPPLLPTEFALDRHGVIWEVMLDLTVRDERTDLITVECELARACRLDDVGGPAYLAQLYEEGHVAYFVPQYARHVREAARARALHQLGAEMTSKGLPETEIEARLAEIPGPLAGALYDPAHDWSKIVEAWRQGRIRTGFGGLDEITGGFGLGDFVVVGGRTSHGKTSFLTALSMRLAERGVPVDYVTLEESSAAITRRMVGNRAAVSIRRLKDGDLQPRELRESERAVMWLKELPLTVTGLDHVRTLEENAVVGTVASSKTAVVIVDHLQQVTTPGKESRVYGLERVLKRLQSVALREGKVVILAAQLNRETEARQGPPRLSDLRDCGAIEQAGRQIILLYWPWKHDPQRNHEDYELYLAKQSDGGTGLVPLRFEAWCGRFSDVDRLGA